ncbi:MAG TPA: hypothetical protein VNZ94_01780 [Xanthobacteraceae bacterium]|nr:hypothetical protein [Xanthobacteraceae bacterium]
MRISFKLAALVLAVAALTVLAYPIAYASADILTTAVDFPTAFTIAGPLAAMRIDHQNLVARAAAKLAEVKDGLSADAVRKIETEHADLVRQAEDLAKRIKDEEERESRAQPAPAPAPNAVELERTRSSEITSLALRHAMPVDFATQHIGAGTSIDEVRKLVLDEVAKRSSQTQINSRVQVITDEGDTIRSAVETAIGHRANPASVKIEGDNPARAWLGMSLLEMGRSFVEETTGQRLRGLGRFELAGRLLGLDSGLRSGGMMSTSDFPAILANVVSKRMRNAYEVAPQNWRPLGRQSNAPDFKQRAVVQLSNLPQFKKVNEGGEFQYAGLSEGQEVYSLGTYGRIVAVTRQTLINDDLGAFDRLPTLLGRAAAETEASIFWAIITGNAQMGDSKALFHADHKNVASAGDDISIATLNEGRAAMRKQRGLAKKEADAEPLNLAPRFLVVSPDNETVAQQFLADIRATESGKVNPFANSLQQITEARLTGGAWYLWADPAMIDTIEYAWLEGEEGLFTEQRLGFEVDGLEVKGRIDFAAKAIDWRGVYRNPGK